MDKFIDREEELQLLENAWKNRPGFIVVYGRRRIGKTRLLLEFLKRVKGIYYLARLTSHEDNLLGLAKSIERIVPGFTRGKVYTSLDTLLQDAVHMGVEVIVIDEFTYWIRIAPRVLSELQYFVDMVLPNTRLLLIICGSIVGVIERSVLSGGSPLYGRRTLSLKLRPLKPWHIQGFLPSYSVIERIIVYGLVGGIPYYLKLFQDNIPLKDNIKNLFLLKNSLLYNEVDFLLREEFRNPSTYSRIIKAIAKGHSTLGKISDATGIPKTHLTSYLETLERIGFIEYRRPLWSKRGYYTVKDYLLRFYYNVIDDVRELIELEQVDTALKEVLSRLDRYMGTVFEDIAYELIPLLKQRNLVEEFDNIGKIVHKGVEIDLALINSKKKHAILIEVKWSKITDQEASRIIQNLHHRASKIKRLEEYTKSYIILAREADVKEYKGNVIDLSMLGL